MWPIARITPLALLILAGQDHRLLASVGPAFPRLGVGSGLPLRIQHLAARSGSDIGQGPLNKLTPKVGRTTMAGFKTHISTSTVLGISYGAAGHLIYDIPLPTAALAGGLCSVAGMLPDVDSDNGVPLRETTAFFAAVTPMFLLDRLGHLELTHEAMILVAGAIYIGIRFGVGELMRRFTVHRGMWHSLPAAAIAGLVAFLLCSCADMNLRLYKTGAMVLGFMTHLLLDELYSIDFSRGRLRLKRSFGTAFKLWGPDAGGNVSAYVLLLGMVALVIRDPSAPHFHRTVPHQATVPPPPATYDYNLPVGEPPIAIPTDPHPIYPTATPPPYRGDPTYPPGPTDYYALPPMAIPPR